MPYPTSRPLRRRAAAVLAIAVAVFLVLAIPAPEPKLPPAPAHGADFAWKRDSLWAGLESLFVQQRVGICLDLGRSDSIARALRRRIAGVGPGTPPPVFDSIESTYFSLAPRAADCVPLLNEYVELYARMRESVKRQSRQWDMDSPDARARLYRVLYGGRAALEEAMLQQPGSIVALVPGTLEPSATPAATSHGVELHSGDIIVSRGGYPTSALIARGSDYPGNFSHVALVHIDSATHAISVIEAHIELGVAVGTLDHYLSDKKLRLMLLRPRADLPALRRDPMLPHRAASAMLARARAGHIPYDFAMDYRDPKALFCTEVASSAYHEQGVDLWMGRSTISHAGLRRWLSGFGVTHFETQEPSDLEYDPQLTVVAEWRDAASLFDDHIDNAVTDALLEGAERGESIAYPWYALPGARLAKAWSRVLERFGRSGPVPEGMRAEAALRNRAYSERHARLAARVRESAAAWTKAHGYRPAYWTLVELAREANAAN